MKTILRHLWRDKVSLAAWIITVAAAIGGVEIYLWILIAFIFRGIMWEGQYVDALDKYVTDPEYRKTLGLDGNHKVSPLDLIFQIFFIIGVITFAVLLVLGTLKL